MAKNLKLNIKNTQLAKALDLGGVKEKLSKKSSEGAKKEKKPASKSTISKAKVKIGPTRPAESGEIEESSRKVKARSKSAFAEEQVEATVETPPPVHEPAKPTVAEELPSTPEEPAEKTPIRESAPKVKLGPTGKHIKDLLPKKEEKQERADAPTEQPALKKPYGTEQQDSSRKKGGKSQYKEFRDLKPSRRSAEPRGFDSRDRHGLREPEEGTRWRKRRPRTKKVVDESLTVRPTELTVRLPIILKDLAAQMKIKASQLVEKLFLQGTIVTLNDILDDETAVQLLGHEFDCEITIDTSEEERIRITDKSIKEEIQETASDNLTLRAPIVAFMGHVDHGKTSLIDYIRKSQRAASEAGDITQHIGAFRCHTAVGDIAILDTPGHEAFSAMRARGAEVTDIVVLVVAGDEGLRQQTEEAIQHAKAAGVTIVVAINKCDKPNFDADNVYRQLADHDLLPEQWGGDAITVNCSAVSGEGVNDLIEMLALQAEILELRANDQARARGTVLESEMHKGLGAVATILIQNGTLRLGDPIVFSEHWCRVKTMHNEDGQQLQEAGPSTPVEITGLSGLPGAGQEFIAVASEKEAKEIAEVRAQQQLAQRLQRKRHTTESFLSEKIGQEVKILNIILRADVQGSLEAIKSAIGKIQSEKVEVNFIFTGIGEISESDIQLAAASKAVILGFHTQVESHAESLIKEYSVHVRLHDIIYHLVDEAKELMAGTLDTIPEEVDKGSAEVRAIFKSSQHGKIAGCYTTEGTIHRNHQVRLIRDGNEVWRGSITSLKREKEDVREVQKGFECGILIATNDINEGDIIEAFEIVYIKQEL